MQAMRGVLLPNFTLEWHFPWKGSAHHAPLCENFLCILNEEQIIIAHILILFIIYSCSFYFYFIFPFLIRHLSISFKNWKYFEYQYITLYTVLWISVSTVCIQQMLNYFFFVLFIILCDISSLISSCVIPKKY